VEQRKWARGRHQLEPQGGGFHGIKDCALFCAHPLSKTMAVSGSQAGQQIARTTAENQHDSKSSHLVPKMSAATVNRRVASSNLAQGSHSCGGLWFQLGSNDGPKNRQFLGLSGAGSTVCECVNSRMSRPNARFFLGSLLRDFGSLPNVLEVIS
jgi:hypothetical protein